MSTPTSVAPAAFLSVRLPSATRDRLKVAAASRGETVQGLVGSLVERFLAEEAGLPPPLAVVLRQLRERADDLRARGIASLSVFGSVARGDAGPGSDIDLLADLDRGALRPGVREAAEREAVRAW
jgi:hypothetical protein